jgi:hypothetical protein
LDLQYQQLIFCHNQIRQAEQHLDLRGAFRQPFVGRLSMAKQVFNDMKRMRDFRPNIGLGMFQCVEHCTQWPLWIDFLDRAAARCNVPIYRYALQLFALVCTGLTRIGERRLLLSMQQCRRLGDASYIGRRGGYGKHQPALGIGTDVRLHVETPRIALFSLMH